MAEQEVVKHTKKVYKIWNSKEHSLLHKIKEFVVEIVIIVFAVTLSIWLHDRSEHAHQQKEVKEFLAGLKEDLQSDKNEIAEDKKAYFKDQAAFSYITGIKNNEKLRQDSVEKYHKQLHGVTGFITNNGRFEGFKSSGKISTIENSNLQNDIMGLYQEDIPDVILSTNSYNTIKQKLVDFCNVNVKRLTDSTTNISEVLTLDEAQNIAKILTDVKEIIDRYNLCIKKIDRITSEIDKENAK